MARNQTVESHSAVEVVIENASITQSVPTPEEQIDFPGLFGVGFVLPDRLSGDDVESVIAVERLRMAITGRRREGNTLVVVSQVGKCVRMEPAADLVRPRQTASVLLFVQVVPELVDAEEALAAID